MTLLKTAILFGFFCCALTALVPAYGQAEYDSYQDDLKEQFKKENWWYRTWNRYEVNPGFSKYSIGPAFTRPALGWDHIENAIGIRLRSTHKEAAVMFFKGNHNYDALDTVVWSNRLSLGYFTPVNLFSIGKRYLDVRGYLLQSAFSLGYVYSNRNHGLYAAPALHFQFPFGLVAVKANFDYVLNDGFNFYPELSLQLDALRTLLDPQTVKTGSYTTTSASAQPLGGGWYRVTTRTTDNQVYIKDIGPFWGVTPRFGRAMSSWSHKPYNSMGLGITGRINFLGADIHVDKGHLVTGVTPNANALDGTVRSKFDNEKVEGLMNTTEITFEGNMDIYGLIMNIFRKNGVSKMGWKTTPLNRFNFHLGATYMRAGNVSYTNEQEAIAYTDAFFAEYPQVERNEINDPLQYNSEWGVTYGISYEMGAVGIRSNNKLSKTMGRGTTIEIYYVLPISRIVKAYR